MIDVSDSSALPDIVYREIQKELLHYDEALLRKPTVVIANKMDKEGAEEGLETLKKCTRLPIVPVSARKNENMESVAQMLRQAYISSKSV